MSDILIRGMEMPHSCLECTLCAFDGCDSDYCPFTGIEALSIGRQDNCPLVELPPHGDLIDRDALLAEYERDERAADEHGREFSFSFDSGGARCTEWWVVQQKLMDAPVIIPTEKGETQ